MLHIVSKIDFLFIQRKIFGFAVRDTSITNVANEYHIMSYHLYSHDVSRLHGGKYCLGTGCKKLTVKEFKELYPGQKLPSNPDDFLIIEVMGNIGGFLGMWMGVSMIDVMNLFEIIVTIIYYCIKKRKSKRKTTVISIA
ncbi:hypothetical protein TNCT_267201 [Trichonephila clavata]|uniref:Uncharacterized protein n=1 Tax=Trichonephila clavata TaxID=2740835 RepID=A0A8X6H5P3_TRICU|nr:hypothetical protein TNCT_267201 [Trichonephila clavata]